MVFLREKYTNCRSIPNGPSSIGQPGKAKKLHLDSTTCGGQEQCTLSRPVISVPVLSQAFSLCDRRVGQKVVIVSEVPKDRVLGLVLRSDHCEVTGSGVSDLTIALAGGMGDELQSLKGLFCSGSPPSASQLG